MFNGQSTMHQIIDPKGLFCSLTLRTVPVAAAVVTVAYRTTALAYLLVSPKSSSAADR